MRRKAHPWRWALWAVALGLFTVAFASGGCDAVSGIDDLAFERGPGTFCESFDDCADGNYCDYEQRVCKPQLPIGSECSGNEQCASEQARAGRCAHGFCCTGPCSGDCFACDAETQEGTCIVLRDDTDPHDDCPGTTGCGRDGQCRGHVRWVTNEGAAGTDMATGVAIDAERNMVFVGTFHDTITIGTQQQPLNGAGLSDVFVAKLDASGVVNWSKRIGGTGIDNAAGVALDSSGNVVVVGDFEGSVQFDASDRTSTEVALGRDAFVLKLDPEGNFLSVRIIGGQGDQSAAGIAVDASDRVVVTGSFVDGIEYATNETAPGNANEDAFVVVYDQTGGFVWSKELGEATYAQRGRSVAVDRDGNVVWAIEGSGDVEQLHGRSEDQDVYLFHLMSDSGDVAWRLLLGGVGEQHAGDLATDSQSKVWVVGSFTNAINIPGAAGFTTVDDVDGYFAVFTQFGAHETSNRIGGQFNQVPTAVAVDADDEVTIAGHFQLALHLGTQDLLEGFGDHDIFVLKLTAQGEHQWAEAFGGKLFDQVLAIAADQSTAPDDLRAGELAVAGSFQASLDLGGTVLQATGDSDFYAAVLAP